MPEGPSIVILREELARAKLAGKRVLAVEGNTKIGKERVLGRKVRAFRSFGKEFFVEFVAGREGPLAMRSHFLLFGSYAINQRKQSADGRERPPRIRLEFENGELNLYASALRYIEEPLDEVYDWRVDVMNDAWSPTLARRKLKATPDEIAADVLLDQDVFAGVGNIIKNEVLYRMRVHPATRVGDLPPRKLGELIKEARNYSFDFLEWKKKFVLRKHWLAHKQRVCKRCDLPILKRLMGKRRRWAWFCEGCQVDYSAH